MIRIEYPKIVVEKAQAIARWANKAGHTQRVRDKLCQDSCGLTHRYLSRIGVTHRSPSNRVLMCLGYELVIRDKITGAEEVLDLKDGRL